MPTGTTITETVGGVPINRGRARKKRAVEALPVHLRKAISVCPLDTHHECRKILGMFFRAAASGAIKHETATRFAYMLRQLMEAITLEREEADQMRRDIGVFAGLTVIQARSEPANEDQHALPRPAE